jgi:hypothetical protein
MKGRNMRIGISIFSLFILPLSLSAQISFERYYGIGGCYSEGRSVFQKSDGGYVFGGCTQFPGTELYVYLVRTDSFGDTVWTRFYGGDETDYGYSMAMTSDGGYIIAGYTKSFGVDSVDVYVVRTDSSGDTLWTRTYGGIYDERGSSIKQTSDGGFIITGYTNSYGAGGYDVYLIRIDSLGDTLWTRTYGDTLDDYAASVEITSDSCFVITGTTWSFGPTNLYFIKIDSLGNVLWERRFGGQEYTEGYAVRQIFDCGYIITGKIYIFMEAKTYVYLIKTDSLGDSLWAKLIGLDYSEGYHVGYSVDQTSDGGYIITGYAQELLVWAKDLFLVKTDSLGDTLWTRLYGYFSGASETGYSVKQTSDGGYIISGNSSGYGHGQAYLIKTDTLGNVGVEENNDIRHKTPDMRLTATPNPFRGSVEIQLCGVSGNRWIGGPEIHIFDVTGRLVKHLPISNYQFPISIFTWDGRNDLGRAVPSGVYFARLTYGDFTASKKLVFLK